MLRRYRAIADDSKYRHFVRIPERIIRCLDHFKIKFDRDTVRERLLAHYLFIGVVDDAIDSGEQQVAETIFDGLLRATPTLERNATRSNVAVVTEILKTHIDDDVYLMFSDRLQQAHQEVVNERAATSIDAYIEHRRALGRATAEQSYLLIRSALGEHDKKLCRLMQDIGAVGCLVDSIIDLRDDSRAGLLSFKPTVFDFARLYFVTLAAGLRVWARKPSLTVLFVEAIIDNIRDRNRAHKVSIVIDPGPGASLQEGFSHQRSAQSFHDNVARQL